MEKMMNRLVKNRRKIKEIRELGARVTKIQIYYEYEDDDKINFKEKVISLKEPALCEVILMKALKKTLKSIGML